MITQVDQYASRFTFLSEEDDSDEYQVKYNVPDKNEIFSSAINKLEKYYTLPVYVSLIDVEFESERLLEPRAIIIQPNYLIDVTAIAEIHKSPKAEQALLYLLKKFMPMTMSKGLLMGNISNYLLDEIITDPDFEISQRLPDIFKLFPIALAGKDDDFVQDVLQSTKLHFKNLKKVVEEEFVNLDIDREKINIEPSFYDINHGIQGRLDILQQDDAAKRMDIIELKSGKIFRPNVYGLNNNHYTQTLLYDLIIKSIFGRKYTTSNYILYSQQEEKTLRFAPAARSQQIESLATRNRLLLMEKALAISDNKDTDIFKLIRPDYFPKSSGFEKTNIQTFYDVYSKASTLSKNYFKSQVAFISKEKQLSKVGKHGLNVDNGLATLWLDNIDQKEQRFAILRNLKIKENKSHESEPLLFLSRSKSTNRLANFRKGDIGILYPSQDGILDDQVFKCTIVGITAEIIEVKLRSKQSNQRIFEKNTNWNIEPDHLDSSYNNMYRSLFAFLSSDQKWQDLWLCTQAPQKTESEITYNIPSLTDQQNQVLGEMMSCEDYYLLWGPPGTGKTSVVLKNYVKEYLSTSDKPLLIMAYTNRAVDEICQAIESLGEHFADNYIRIGSRYATGDPYKDKLLHLALSQKKSRKELKDFIQSKAIIVGTLSSLVGKSSFLDLIQIETVVIDEASQILDPMLCGFLNRFKKFILIGDHKQLPAVVKQTNEESIITDDDLIKQGIVDHRDSLFERLYKKCVAEKWDWAVGKITFQGRMHKELMQFPNSHFYNGELQPIDKIERLSADLSVDSEELGSHRKIFITAPADDDLNLKTNIHEARIVASTLEKVISRYKANNQEIVPSSIGIITPYRAQIAQIKNVLDDMEISYSNISIDTVERYQGGARDIIILSFCVNKTHQLRSLVSLSAEGIDRKLNVALTRAKEQIILVGNKDLLSTNKVYKELLESYNHLD